MDVSYGILSSHFYFLDFGEINKDFVIKWFKKCFLYLVQIIDTIRNYIIIHIDIYNYLKVMIKNIPFLIFLF